MTKFLRAVLVVALLSACAVGMRPLQASATTTSPTAQPSGNVVKTYDLKRVTCRDLLQANVLDRSSAIMFLWGFEAGRRNFTTFNTEQLEQATRGLMDVCEEQPSLPVFAALTTVIKRHAK